jgi:hypothetical protein
MNTKVVSALKRELASRGFTPDGYAPSRSVWVIDEHLASVEIADLLDTMVARREKIFRSQGVIGADIAKSNYQDTDLLVEAIKAVIRRLSLP